MAGEREIRIAALSACLALVRPVGMTEGETLEWLAVAADTLKHIPAVLIEKGAREARKKCTHHAQIVPAIVEATKEDLLWFNRPKLPPRLRLVAPERPALPDELPDPETLMPSLRRIGLERGWLIERAGRIVWSEDSAA